jgi:putative transposase
MARSTFYYHLNQLSNPDKYQTVKSEMKHIYKLHKGRYGYRRIHLELKNRGFVINHKTVFSLMSELGLKSLIRVKKYVSYRGDQGKIAPNILQRNFKANQPEQKWVTDITEFKVKEKKLPVAPELSEWGWLFGPVRPQIEVDESIGTGVPRHRITIRQIFPKMR